MKPNIDYETDIAKVKGIGAGKSGVEHWWFQRITSFALIPIVLWLIYSIVGLVALDYEHFLIWTKNYFNAILIMLFVLISSIHMRLGLSVITEDYVHMKGIKYLLLALINIFSYILPVALLVAILKIFTGE